MFVIGVNSKPMKMAKNLFWLPFGLNIEHRGILKGGVPLVMRGSKGTLPPLFQHNLTGSWDTVKPDIVGVAYANML